MDGNPISHQPHLIEICLCIQLYNYWRNYKTLLLVVSTLFWSHLQAGVEAPSLLFQVFWCRIQPHKAVIPKDYWCTTRQVVEMCFLPLDQRRRKLNQHSLTQLIVQRKLRQDMRVNFAKTRKYCWLNFWNKIPIKVSLQVSVYIWITYFSIL